VLLVELLVAFAVLAVLAGLALPSFQLLIRLHRVRTVVQDLQSDIVWARAESIRRGTPVVLRFEADACPAAPTEARQRCGWIVFDDTSRDEIRQDDETLLRSAAAPAGTTVRYSAGSEAVAFDARGNMSKTGNSFTVAAIGASPQDPTTRTLCVSSGGRTRIEQGGAC